MTNEEIARNGIEELRKKIKDSILSRIGLPIYEAAMLAIAKEQDRCMKRNEPTDINELADGISSGISSIVNSFAATFAAKGAQLAGAHSILQTAMNNCVEEINEDEKECAHGGHTKH